MNSRLSLETFLCLVYLVIRASPTGKPNEELNLKTCTLLFLFFTTPTQQGKGYPKWLFNM